MFTFLNIPRWELLFRQEECADPLREFSFMVNNQEPAILSHPLLSVIKMADLEVTIPDMSAARSGRPSPVLQVLGFLPLLVFCSTPT